MAAVYDTPMLDYHDTDVQMHTNSDPWFHEEALMEDESTFSLARSSSDGDLVDVEIEMENYVDSNPEYDMVDEAAAYSATTEPEDIIVVDPHPQEMDAFANHTSADPSAIESVPSFSSSLSLETENMTSETFSTETEMHHHTSVSVLLESPESDLVKPTFAPEQVTQDSLSAVDESSSHTEDLTVEHAPNSAADSAVPYLESEVAAQDASVEDAPAEEAAGTTENSSEERIAESVERSTNELGTEPPRAVPGENPVEPSLEEQPAVVETEEGQGVVSESDPHEISDGVYIDPPPAPSPSDPSSSTTETPSYAVLLSDQPTLYYEPLSTVFDALRNNAELSSVTDLSHVELVLDAYDLQLTIPEDNIFARETSLHDLNVLHDGSDFSGPLRLRLQLINPRFIVRYRLLQEQVMRLNLAEAGEEYSTEELNDNSLQEIAEQERGPDYTEENAEEEYAQEQEEENSANHDNHLQNEHPENDSGETHLDRESEENVEQPTDALPDNEDGQQVSDDAVPYPDADEGVDNSTATAFDEEQQEQGPGSEDEAQDLGADVQQSTNGAEDPEEDTVHATNEEVPQAEEEQSDYEKADNVDEETVDEVSAESRLTEIQNHEESYKGEDLYYPENAENVGDGSGDDDDADADADTDNEDADADAEWDGVEYEEVTDGVAEGGNSTFETEEIAEAEHDSASVQSSVTLSSGHSKRSIHDVEEEDAEENPDDSASVPSSPGTKRARMA